MVSQTLMYEQVSRRIEVGNMNRRRADTVVGGLVAVVLIVGGVLSWQAYQQQQAFDQMGSMMGTSMGSVHGTNPIWYVLGTLLVSAVIGVGYLVIRDEVTSRDVTDRPQNEMANPTDPEGDESPEGTTQPDGAINPESQPQARVLDLLPDDERRILEPVISSPGITQIELRDRSDFSKSKVSQTVSALEKRGLLYRERQGRTYRIYPSDDLQEKQMN
jgi:predicted transcriptional regulator